MNLYSDFASRRVRQIVGDLIGGIVLIASITIGVAVHGAIAALAAVGDGLREAGTGFEDTMSDVGDRLGAVPLIGDGIRAPLDAASGAGGSLADAGETLRSVIETIAVTAGIGVTILPLSILLLVWVWPRVRFARRSAETRALLALGDGEALLSLRALQSASASELATISHHPVREWQAGVPAVTRELARLDARTAGVRLAAAGAAQRP